MIKKLLAFLIPVVMVSCDPVYAKEPSIIDKMVASPSRVTVCNTFVTAYANGIYDYGDGINDSSEAKVPDVVVYQEDKDFYLDLHSAGLKVAKEYIEQTGMDRLQAHIMASSVGTGLMNSCNAARGDRSVIDALPNLGELTKKVLDMVYGTDL